MDRPEAFEEVSEAVETGLGSVAKLKILRLMLRNQGHAFTLYELEQRISVKPVSIRTHIADLKKLGWVQELPYRPRKYEVNLGDEMIKRLLTFFESIRYV